MKLLKKRKMYYSDQYAGDIRIGLSIVYRFLCLWGLIETVLFRLQGKTLYSSLSLMVLVLIAMLIRYYQLENDSVKITREVNETNSINKYRFNNKADWYVETFYSFLLFLTAIFVWCSVPSFHTNWTDSIYFSIIIIGCCIVISFLKIFSDIMIMIDAEKVIAHPYTNYLFKQGIMTISVYNGETKTVKFNDKMMEKRKRHYQNDIAMIVMEFAAIFVYFFNLFKNPIVLLLIIAIPFYRYYISMKESSKELNYYYAPFTTLILDIELGFFFTISLAAYVIKTCGIELIKYYQLTIAWLSKICNAAITAISNFLTNIYDYVVSTPEIVLLVMLLIVGYLIVRRNLITNKQFNSEVIESEIDHGAK